MAQPPVDVNKSDLEVVDARCGMSSEELRWVFHPKNTHKTIAGTPPNTNAAAGGGGAISLMGGQNFV